MDNNDFNEDAFFTDDNIADLNDDSMQQINEAAIQEQIGQLGPSAVGIDALHGVPLPVSPQVVERILHLHHTGCSTRLSWSRQGHIASISDDGTSIDLQCLIFDRRKRTWLLNEKRSEHVGLGQLATLAWSPMATDLAVVDTQGRLSILRPVGTAANRLIEVRAGAQDQVQDLGQAIGLHWLSQDRAERPKQVVQYTSKQEDGGKWVHNLVKALPLQPLYQRAVIVVDRKGTMAWIYEKLDGSFAKVTTQLSTDNDIYTHAAFAPTTEGKLLVVLHAYTGRLVAYWVSIDFTAARQDASVSPSVKVELACNQLPLVSPVDNQMYDPDLQQLTHLGIISTSEVEKSMRLPPTVYGIYTNTSKNLDTSQNGHWSTSTIRRWTISPAEQSLHPMFDKLPAKAKSNHSSFSAAVQALANKEEQTITNAILLENSHGLYISTQDGRSDLLAIEDLSSLSFPSGDNNISSLVQCGFAFPLTPLPTTISLSPNHCAIAAFSPNNDTLEILNTTYQPTTQSLDHTNPSPSDDAANAVIVLSFARSCWTNSNIDDLLSTILSTLPPSMSETLITSLYQTLFRETEFMHEKNSNSELEKVVQKPVLTKVFSFHYGVAFLSLKQPQQPPTTTTSPPTPNIPLAAQWVWIASNLRFVAQLLYISIREVQQPDSTPSTELVDMVCGNIKWTLDLVRYMALYIFEVSDRQTNPSFFNPLPPGTPPIDGSQGLVSLLLNCHWSRQFFIAIVRAMRVLCKLPEPRSAQQTEIIRTIMQWSSGKGLNLIAVEALLDPRWSGWADQELENDMAKISARQVRMMATGVVEGGYRGTVERVLGKLFNVKGGMREKGAVDRLKLGAERVELGWVLLDDGWDGSERGKGRRVFDVHKKKVITKGVREVVGVGGGGVGVGVGEEGREMIKRCVRCGRHNEDVNGTGKEFPRHVAGLMMRCVCDGPWIVEPWENAVKGG